MKQRAGFSSLTTYLTRGLLLTSLSLMGCVATEDDDSNIDVDYDVISSGTDPVNTDESKFSKVIYNQYDYESELSYYTTDDADDIDFDEYRVVVLDLGERDSDQYSITINSMTKSDYAVTLSYTLTVPGDDCEETSSTNPYAILSINTSLEVVVQESLDVASCTES